MTWATIDKPKDSDTHTRADFIEILCLTSIDQEYSVEDYADYLNDYSNIIDEGWEDTDSDLAYLSDLNKDLNRKGKVSEEEKNTIIGQLKWRKEAFSTSYPFLLRNDGKTLVITTKLSNKHKTYLFLLLAANLPFLQKKGCKPFTEAFEKLSLINLKKIWPHKGKTVAFGKNQTEFTGTKEERLRKLAEKTGHRGDKMSFRASDSGDGGIDLAAWVMLDNYENYNIFSAFAQCACSRNTWPTKQREVSEKKIGQRFHLQSPMISLLYTPILYRDNHGRWAFPDNLDQITFIDRLRLMNFLPSNMNKYFENNELSLKQYLDYRRDD